MTTDTKIGEPAPNWCRTCGRRPNDPMAALCLDTHHRTLERLHPQPAELAEQQGAQEVFDLDANVSIPRDLIGAACYAIRTKRDAPLLLEKMRRYTTGDLCIVAQGIDLGVLSELAESWKVVSDPDPTPIMQAHQHANHCCADELMALIDGRDAAPGVE